MSVSFPTSPADGPPPHISSFMKRPIASSAMRILVGSTCAHDVSSTFACWITCVEKETEWVKIAVLMLACVSSMLCGRFSVPISDGGAVCPMPASIWPPIVPVPCCGARMIGIVICFPAQRRALPSRLTSESRTVFQRSASTSGPFISRRRFAHVVLVSTSAIVRFLSLGLEIPILEILLRQPFVAVWPPRHRPDLGRRTLPCRGLHGSSGDRLPLLLVLANRRLANLFLESNLVRRRLAQRLLRVVTLLHVLHGGEHRAVVVERPQFLAEPVQRGARQLLAL